LPELLLMRVDKITMATSVEARVPFLDHHLVEYASGISVDRKIERRTGKLVLKRALEKVLPPELLYSRKRGFGAPIREWFRGQTGEKLVSLLMNSRLRRRDFFDYSFVAQLVDEHRRAARDWSFHLVFAEPQPVVRPLDRTSLRLDRATKETHFELQIFYLSDLACLMDFFIVSATTSGVKYFAM
jgi:asparagine synthetase B (glutamine-hydrolysing)